MQKVIEVCDVCEDLKKEVTEYAIKTSKGQEKKVVLCSVHARPLEVMLGNAKRPGRPPAKKAAAKRVKTLDEIEAEKQSKTN